MSRVLTLPLMGLTVCLALAASVQGQTRAYIGFAYPAGGQQGTTFQVRLGGQGLDDVSGVLVTGEGVSAKVVEYFRRLGPQEITLLREQLNEVRPPARGRSRAAVVPLDEETQRLVARIEQRMGGYVNRPACVSIASLALIEVTIAPDAEPGERELRLVTPRAVSNPLFFHVGQLPEVVRQPMKTCDFQVLGKEELALRKRPPEEVESRITIPCTANGQIGSGEINRYRFDARKGQKLVVSVAARALIPYIADAVPGWFQPVLALHDAEGKELAYNDDFRFQPDPTLLFEAPRDGEYVLTITDALFRGREDFIYRVAIGELPFVTSIFPLGGQVGVPPTIEAQGWNLDSARLVPPSSGVPGVQFVTVRKDALVSNRLPFELDTLPECFDQEPNDSLQQAQALRLPVIVNGRIDRSGDWDIFRVSGRAGDTMVAEVRARRLDSPLDSMLKVTDATGRVLAFNDDHEDPGTGLNTHHADSYLRVELPADGDYFVHLGDTTRQGGEEYAYRLRISPPRPDFALRVVPSSIAMRGRASANVNVYAIRKDGFDGEIKLGLKNAPSGFSASTVTLSRNQDMGRFALRANMAQTEQPVPLTIEGRAKTPDGELAQDAVPAEDRMQAFLWRHLMPAQDLQALVYDPSYQPPPKRVPPSTPEAEQESAQRKPAEAPKFTKAQVAGRLRQLKLLYDEWLLTDDFYNRKVAECEAAQ